MSAVTVVNNGPLEVPVPPQRVYGCSRLCALEFGGADATGKTDATAAIQKQIDALPAAGGTVHLPSGTYLIDPTVSLKLRSNMWLAMEEDTILQLTANNHIRYAGLALNGVSNVRITGGQIIGDRDNHTFTPQKVASQNTHEWGHGITIYGSANITIEGTNISKCCGDGISIADSGNSDVHCDDIFLVDVISTQNRRQGCSIGRGVQNVFFIGGELSYTNGTAPECGVDIEPENGGPRPTQNIQFHKVRMHHNNANGLLGLQRQNVTVPVQGLVVNQCTLDYNKACGIYAAQVQGLMVYANLINHNGQSGINVNNNTTGVTIDQNTFGFNYTRGGAGTDRKDATITGAPGKPREADLLLRNDPTENTIGTNTYQ